MWSLPTMANTYSALAAKIGWTCPGRLRVAGLAVGISAGSILAGCSGVSNTTARNDTPNWSLADRAPVALGGPNGSAARAPIEPVYEYRGGRDPVTGRTIGALPSQSSTTGPGAERRVIEIRKGDTLHGLSLTHHVSVKALMAANNLTSATIRPGQKLVVPQG
jgi:hypothetical protein